MTKTLSPLAHFMYQPIALFGAAQFLDVLVRSAMLCRATKIAITCESRVFKFEHDGDKAHLERIHATWQDQGRSGRVDLSVPHGIGLTQILFDANTLCIHAGGKCVTLNLHTLCSDSSWVLHESGVEYGVQVIASGVRYQLEAEVRKLRFACSIPVFFNGEETPTLETAETHMVAVNGQKVSIDLPSAHLGFHLSTSGKVNCDSRIKSIVYVPCSALVVDSSYTLLNEADVHHKAKIAFMSAVMMRLTEVNAQNGADSTHALTNYGPLMTKLFPAEMVKCGFISSDTLIATGTGCQPAHPMLYGRAQLEQATKGRGRSAMVHAGLIIGIGVPPRPSGLECVLACTAYRVLQDIADMYVDADSFIHPDHWLRDCCVDLSHARYSVKAHGNIKTHPELVNDVIKVRLADYITASVTLADNSTIDTPISDWILTTETQPSETERMLSGLAGRKSMQVLYVNRYADSLPNHLFPRAEQFMPASIPDMRTIIQFISELKLFECELHSGE